MTNQRFPASLLSYFLAVGSIVYAGMDWKDGLSMIGYHILNAQVVFPTTLPSASDILNAMTVFTTVVGCLYTIASILNGLVTLLRNLREGMQKLRKLFPSKKI